MSTVSLDLCGGLELGLLLLGGTSSLDFLGTLLGLLFTTLLLGILHGGISGGLPLSIRLIPLRQDILPAGTNDSSLHLGCFASLALGNFFGGTFAVETAGKDGPVNFGGLLFGPEEGLTLSGNEAVDLVVGADDQLSTRWVDLVTGEVAKLSSIN